LTDLPAPARANHPRSAGARLFLDWTEHPAEGRGIQLLSESGEWRLEAYDALAHRVHEVGAALRGGGVKPSDVVAICEADPCEFLTALYGVWNAGAVAVPVPTRPPSGVTFDESVAHIRRTVGPAAGLGRGFPDRDGAAADELIDSVWLNPERGEAVATLVGDEPALIQFTSGSSGPPSAVCVSFSNLAAHLRGIQSQIGWSDDMSLASWLPLHHDMGLIGLAVTAISTQAPLWQMRPEQFLIDPTHWISCLGERGVTMTAAPPFAYGTAARRCSNDDAKHWDFSGVRAAIVAAERISVAPLSAFIERFGPHGFRAEMFRPAYGLAEATLTVTGHRGLEPPAVLHADWTAAAPGRPLERVTLDPLSPGSSEGSGLVTSGTPLAGLEVEIRGPDGEALDEGHLGEIAVRGPTVARPQALQNQRLVDDGWLLTGDIGVQIGGELYVVGRFGDSIKVRGRPVHAETLEAAVSAAAKIPAPRCLALASAQMNADAVVILVEGDIGSDRTEAARRAAQAIVGPSVDVAVRIVDRGAIARTTSGKPRRRMMWKKVASEQVDVSPNP
jgi:fatty-acyl-CoA synthase